MQTNQYKNIIRNEEEEKQRQLKEKVAAQSHGHYTDKHIDSVTKDFCEWVLDLGGNEDNIEEDTVGDLFAIGHEAKPPLAVPLNVIQLIDVPHDLTQEAREARQKAEANKRKKARGKRGKKAKAKVEADIPEKTRPSFTPGKKVRVQEALVKEMEDLSKGLHLHISPETLKNAQLSTEKRLWVYSGTNTSKTTRENCRYGAWYLEPKKWKKLKPGEKLNATQSIEYMSDIKKQSNKFDEELAPMHVTKVFMNYVYQTGKRKPDFFHHIEKIQEKLHREEFKRAQEAELHRQKMLRRMFRENKDNIKASTLSRPQTSVPLGTPKHHVTFKDT